MENYPNATRTSNHPGLPLWECVFSSVWNMPVYWKIIWSSEYLSEINHFSVPLSKYQANCVLAPIESIYSVGGLNLGYEVGGIVWKISIVVFLRGRNYDESLSWLCRVVGRRK